MIFIPQALGFMRYVQAVLGFSVFLFHFFEMLQALCVCPGHACRVAVRC
jgi:hypothetical protein